MDEYGEYGEWVPDQPAYSPAPRGYGYGYEYRRRRRWPLVVGLALAFTLALGIGALLGSRIIGITQAAGLTPGVTYGSQSSLGGPGAGSIQTLAGTPGAGPQGQCDTLTVSSVSGSTIVAKAPDGSTVTIHTTSSTQYTRAGQTVAASAVTAGSQISVQSTRNSDGSITATRIDIR